MKPLEFVKAYRKTLLFAGGTLVLAIAVVWGLSALGSAINESRVNRLEADKQKLLKAGSEAHDRELILQGQIKAKDEVIKSLTSQIAKSNQRVSNAHNETQSAKSNLSKVRSDPPKFNSSDDAGRVREFSTAVRELYPDPPR